MSYLNESKCEVNSTMKIKALFALSIALMLSSLVPSSIASDKDATQITAYWTGKSRQVTTVTGRYAVECEYSYYSWNGRRLTNKLFPNSCPNSIEIY